MKSFSIRGLSSHAMHAAHVLFPEEARICLAAKATGHHDGHLPSSTSIDESALVGHAIDGIHHDLRTALRGAGTQETGPKPAFFHRFSSIFEAHRSFSSPKWPPPSPPRRNPAWKRTGALFLKGSGHRLHGASRVDEPAEVTKI